MVSGLNNIYIYIVNASIQRTPLYRGQLYMYTENNSMADTSTQITPLYREHCFTVGISIQTTCIFIQKTTPYREQLYTENASMHRTHIYTEIKLTIIIVVQIKIGHKCFTAHSYIHQT